MTQQAVGTVAANTQPGAHYGNFGGQPAPALFNWFPDLAQGSFTGRDSGGLERRRQLQLHRARR